MLFHTRFAGKPMTDDSRPGFSTHDSSSARRLSENHNPVVGTVGHSPRMRRTVDGYLTGTGKFVPFEYIVQRLHWHRLSIVQVTPPLEVIDEHFQIRYQPIHILLADELVQDLTMGA